MKNKKVLIVPVIMLITFLCVFGGVKLTSRLSQPQSTLQTSDAVAELNKTMNKINVTKSELIKSAVELDIQDEASELPDVSDDDITVRPKTTLYAEIFATGEKAGTDKDGWMNDVAEAFNKEGFEIDGQPVSVMIRKVASGLQYDYVRTGKYIPDGYSPSSSIYARMLEYSGIPVETLSESLVMNTAGIMVSEKRYEELTQEYGTVNLRSIIEATAADKIVAGYTDPFTSCTGLNFLISTLKTADPANPLSEDAVETFRAFQKNVPYVATTTQQMIKSAEKGSFDSFVSEYQTYTNSSSQKAAYKFIPFGYPHDNPLLTTSGCDSTKKEILSLFADYAANEKWQALAEQYGFNRDIGYVTEISEATGEQLMKAQALWKEEKDAGQDIIAVFIADLSGSMSGARVNMLKQSLINGMQYINENNYIGLVSYSDNVQICLPINKFDLNQKAYFKGAVENMGTGGNTATYDGIMAATQLLMTAKEEHPDAKCMLFVLSDGAENGSRTRYSTMTSIISTLKIPVYTIGYDANVSALEAISDINEAEMINADTDDLMYKIKNLFNSTM